MQVTDWGGYYWYDPWWGPYGGTTHVSYYEESTLVLDIVHWEKKELAWRGLATGTVREDNRGGKQAQLLVARERQIVTGEIQTQRANECPRPGRPVDGRAGRGDRAVRP